MDKDSLLERRRGGLGGKIRVPKLHGEYLRVIPADLHALPTELSARTALSLLKGQEFDLMIVRPLVWPPSAAAIVWASDSPYNQFGYKNARVDAAAS